MWTATVQSKDLTKGNLQIGVIYTDGQETFSEVYFISSVSEIDSRIAGRIDQLNRLEAIVVPLGQFVPNPVIVTPDPQVEALRELKKLQELVSLGVLKETDQVVLDAIQVVKDTL